MCVLVIISLSIILMYSSCSEMKLQQTDNPEISFRYHEKYGTEYTVEKYEPVDIVLDNFFAKYAWCLNFHYTGPDDVFIKHTTLDGSSDSVICVPKVKDNMISKWWCVFLQEHQYGKPYSYLGRNYTAQNIVFNLRAKATSSNTSFDMNLVYIGSAIGLAGVLIVITLILTKKYCWKRSEIKPLQLPIDPDSVFYVNLEIFRQQYEREQQDQQEPEYEEID